MSDLVLGLVVGGFFVGLLGAITFSLRGVFRMHDPARATVKTQVDADGRFRLEVPPAEGPREVFVRVALDGDSDDLDLCCGARLHVGTAHPHREAARAVERRSGRRTPGLGFAAPEEIQSLRAVSGGRASFALVDVPAAGGTVEGQLVVAASNPLIEAWVYVP